MARWLFALVVVAACTPATQDNTPRPPPTAEVVVADAAPEASLVVVDAAPEPRDAEVVEASARPMTDDEREVALAEKMAKEGKRGCAGTSHLIDAKGEVTRCYPYRCRANACLTKCASTDDCVPSAKPGESLVIKGWPILCGGHVAPSAGKTAECVPLSPESVHPRH